MIAIRSPTRRSGRIADFDAVFSLWQVLCRLVAVGLSSLSLAVACTPSSNKPSIRTHHLFHPLQAKAPSASEVGHPVLECVVGRSATINSHETPSAETVIIDLGYPGYGAQGYQPRYYVEFFELERKRAENQPLLAQLERKRQQTGPVFLGRYSETSNWHFIGDPSRCQKR